MKVREAEHRAHSNRYKELNLERSAVPHDKCRAEGKKKQKKTSWRLAASTRVKMSHGHGAGSRPSCRSLSLFGPSENAPSQLLIEVQALTGHTRFKDE